MNLKERHVTRHWFVSIQHFKKLNVLSHHLPRLLLRQMLMKVRGEFYWLTHFFLFSFPLFDLPYPTFSDILHLKTGYCVIFIFLALIHNPKCSDRDKQKLDSKTSSSQFIDSCFHFLLQMVKFFKENRFRPCVSIVLKEPGKHLLVFFSFLVYLDFLKSLRWF